ncbi:MAG: NB-ARC domain-containing protein [Cyanobacteria bacterium J06621_8]
MYSGFITFGYKENSSNLSVLKARSIKIKKHIDKYQYQLINFELEEVNVKALTGLPLLNASSASLSGIILSSNQGQSYASKNSTRVYSAMFLSKNNRVMSELLPTASGFKNLGSKSHYSHQPRRKKRKDYTVNETRQINLIQKLQKKVDPDQFYTNVKLPGKEKEFIDRSYEKKEIIKRLSDDFREHIIVIEGINGIGKTALVKDIVRTCIEENSQGESTAFKAIISISVKQIYSNIISYSKYARTEPILQKIFRVIAETVNSKKILKARKSQQLRVVYDLLKLGWHSQTNGYKHKILLIIDNLESIDSEDRQQVISFLADLPAGTKAIITTKSKMEGFSSVNLKELSIDNSLQFINQKIRYKKINLTEQEKKDIIENSNGIPIVISYAIGREKAKDSGCKVERFIAPKKNSSEKLVSLSFEHSISLLKERLAFEILLALVIFQDAPCKEALLYVAQLENENVSQDLSLLEELAFIQKREGKYYILATTREYALKELAKYPEVEAEARERWILWYLNFTEKNGGKDSSEWSQKLQILDRERDNIFSVLHWCSSQDLYYDALRLWKNIDSYIDLSGYWQIRRYWWEWLVQESDLRADIATYVKAMSERAWTLILMNKTDRGYLDEADRKLAKAFELSKYARPETQIRLLIYIAVHRLIIRKYEESHDLLEKANRYIEIYETDLTEEELGRFIVLINYHQAENIYWQRDHEKNNLSFAELQKKLEEAKKIFYVALEKANEIKWERYVNYIYNWLGRIFIDIGKLEKAEQYLLDGLEIAISNREDSRIAYYCDVYSLLEEKRNNFNKSDEFKKIAKYFAEKEDISLEGISANAN